jgi:hypothetical protein
MTPLRRLDFAQPAQAPRSRWLWVLLGVAALSLLAAAWEAAAQMQSLNQARSSLQDLQRRLQASAPAPTASLARTARADKTERLQGQALRSLYWPWLPLLDTVERAAQAPVALRHWSVDARFSRLQIELESRGLPEVFAYVAELQRLAQDEPAGPLGAVQLLSHEWLGPAAHPHVRARLSITLKPAHTTGPATTPADEPIATAATRVAQGQGVEPIR